MLGHDSTEEPSSSGQGVTGQDSYSKRLHFNIWFDVRGSHYCKEIGNNTPTGYIIVFYTLSKFTTWHMARGYCFGHQSVDLGTQR